LKRLYFLEFACWENLAGGKFKSKLPD